MGRRQPPLLTPRSPHHTYRVNMCAPLLRPLPLCRGFSASLKGVLTYLMLIPPTAPAAGGAA